MKAVILSGGRGTRLSEETQSRPKPLVEAGGHPLLWHIMQNYSRFGVTEFIILVGYKGQQIREYFADYWLHQSDITFDLSTPELTIHKIRSLPWKVTVLDTGLETQTGGRLARIKDLISEDFFLTYGDGVSAVNIKKLVNFHIKNKKKATLIAVKPQGRFGSLKLKGNKVEQFLEKPLGDGGWVNGGFFVLNKDIFNYIRSEKTIWEREPLERLSKNNQLISYKFNGIWYAMDTLKDKNYLENLWSSGKAPWKIWR
jgi:glucose-1-phosphate cytidylyltransferase